MKFSELVRLLEREGFTSSKRKAQFDITLKLAIHT
jgi:hypothetical protein